MLGILIYFVQSLNDSAHFSVLLFYEHCPNASFLLVLKKLYKVNPFSAEE